MARRPGLGMFILGFLAAVALSVAPALAQSSCSIYLDFDDDGNPWTLRTTLPQGVTTGTVKFVLEVDALPLPPELIEGTVTEGCCDGPEQDGHYGTQADVMTMAFDPAFVTDFQTAFPTCTFCCPWILMLTLNPAAPVEPGQRYFIGETVWNAYCDINVPCAPPTEFVVDFLGIGGTSAMAFVCPPTAGDPVSWGRIRSLYR